MIRRIVLAFVLCLTPAMAGASTIDFTGLGHAEVVTIGGVRSITAWAGELNWQWISGQPEGTPGNFFSYCVDVLNNETDYEGVTAVAVSSLSSASLKKAAWLLNTYADTAHATAGAAGNAMAAGLQLAIWEVLYDNSGYNLATGNFYASASGAALGYGSSYLSDLTAVGLGYLSADALYLDADNPRYGVSPGQGPGQDQITKSVPEPGTLVLLGAGLIGMVSARKKKTRFGSPAV